MSIVDNVADKIADIPRPLLLGGAAVGATIGAVIIWRRRAGATETAPAGTEGEFANLSQATQTPSTYGLAGSEYTSTVASDYPPQIGVGAGSLSLTDLLAAVGQIQELGMNAIGGGSAASTPTTTWQFAEMAPNVPPRDPISQNPGITSIALPMAIREPSMPAPSAPVTTGVPGLPTWGAVSAAVSSGPGGTGHVVDPKYPFRNERGAYRVVQKRSPANGNRMWNYRYYAPNDDPKIAIGPA